MLLVLKGTISLRRVFGVPTTYVSFEKKLFRHALLNESLSNYISIVGVTNHKMVNCNKCTTRMEATNTSILTILKFIFSFLLLMFDDIMT